MSHTHACTHTVKRTSDSGTMLCFPLPMTFLYGLFLSISSKKCFWRHLYRVVIYVNSLFGMLIRNNLCDLTISSYYTLVYSCAIRSWKTYQSSFLYLRSYCIGHPVNRRSCSWKHRFFFKVFLQPRCIDNRPGRFSVDINHATKKWCILLYVKNIYVHE